MSPVIPGIVFVCAVAGIVAVVLIVRRQRRQERRRLLARINSLHFNPR